MKQNKMKAKMSAGEPAYGVSVMIPSPQIVEMLGALGFDWVLIDCEHGTISLESVELMSMAAEAVGVTPMARPATKSPEHILQVMDRGIMGVQVPHVNNAEDARNAVAAVKYHPLGQRGLAAGSRPSGYGFGGSMEQYVQAANRESLVCVQLEEQEAVRNAAEILEVDGVDVFFVGPSDLSQSMGHPGDPKAEPVRQAIDETLDKILAAGRIPGLPAGTEAVRAATDRGALYTYTHLPRLLAAGASGFFDAARG